VEVQIDFAHVGLFVAIQTESKITRVDLELWEYLLYSLICDYFILDLN
jgi:hypothetical protein